MSEEKSSSIGTMIIVAIAAGLIGYVIGKPDPPQVQAKAPDTSEKPKGLKETVVPEKAKHDLTKGLMAYYPLDGDAKDMSGNGNDGEVKGATLTTDRNGSAEKAYSFNGASQGILVSDSSSKLAPASLTASCWVFWSGNFDGSKPDGQRYGTVLYKGLHTPFPNMAYSFEIDQEGSSGRLRGRSDSAKFGNNTEGRKAFLDAASPMPTDEWVHCVMTVNDRTKTAKLYINGVLNDLEVFHGTINQDDKVLSIGKYGYNDDWDLKGKVDDVRLYNRALSAEEVKALYDLEKPKGK